MEPTIRDAETADLAAIFTIYNEQVLHGTATFDTEPRDVETDGAWLTDRDVRRHPVLVYELDSRTCVGWASLSPWSSRPAYARTVEASVYVDPRNRRRGVGRALLSALIGRARTAGLGVIVGRIAAGNPSSHALMRGLGFQRIGTMRRCGEKLGQVLDVDLVDLRLDEALGAR